MKPKPVDALRWWQIDAAGLAGCALVTAVCYYALINPAIRNHETQLQMQPMINQRTQALQAERATLASLESELSRVTTELAGLSLKLESASQVNSRLASLADIASDQGLDLHQLLPDPLKSGERYDIVPIFLSGSGDYSQVTRFMRRVNERFADVAIVGFDLQSPGQPGKPARFDIGLAWYTLPAMSFVEP